MHKVVRLLDCWSNKEVKEHTRLKHFPLPPVHHIPNQSTFFLVPFSHDHHKTSHQTTSSVPNHRRLFVSALLSDFRLGDSGIEVFSQLKPHITCQLATFISTKETKVLNHEQKLLYGTTLRRLKETMGYKKQDAQTATKSTIVLQIQVHQQ
ncbi:hypothetical protein L1887_14414 [Cichorium endivia]|nr:hypothetical protein L1887_14414 [Cichorium endivia]